MKMQNEKYLATAQLTKLYPYSDTTLRNIIYRAEFAPYRREGERKIEILYCDETKKLLEHFIKIKQRKRGDR